MPKINRSARYWSEVWSDLFREWIEAETPGRSEELHDACELADRMSRRCARGAAA